MTARPSVLTQLDQESKEQLHEGLVQLATIVVDVHNGRLSAEHAAAEYLAEICQLLQGVVVKCGGVSLRIDNKGAFSTLDGVPFNSDSPALRQMGRWLSEQGVELWVLDGAMQLDHLLQFWDCIAHPPKASDDENDIVTLWFERGVTTIRFPYTRFPAADLAHAAAPPETREVNLFATLLAGHGAAQVGALGQRLREASTRAPTDPLRPRVSLDAPTRVALDGILEPFIREPPASVRKRFGASLFAVLSAHQPALSRQEIAFLFSRLVTQTLMAMEYDEVVSTVTNLEFLVAPASRVSQFTRDAAQSVLTRLHSSHTLIVLARSLGATRRFAIPDKLTAWLIGDRPLAKWMDAVSQISEEELPFLIALFQALFDQEDPFWTEAIEALPPDQGSFASQIVSQFGMTVGVPGGMPLSRADLPWPPEDGSDQPDFGTPKTGRSVLPGIPLPTAAEQIAMSSDPHEEAIDDLESDSSDSWEAFDFERLSKNITLEDEEDHEMAALDAELAAFLKDADTNLSSTGDADGADGDAGGAKPEVPESLLRSLEALEQSLHALSRRGITGAAHVAPPPQAKAKKDQDDEGSR